MICCSDLIDALGDLVADELSPERRAEMDGHLACCPPCVAFAESYRITIQLSRRLPASPVPPHLLARLQDAVRIQPPAG